MVDSSNNPETPCSEHETWVLRKLGGYPTTRELVLFACLQLLQCGSVVEVQPLTD